MIDNRRVLLVGGGADIGANILYLSATGEVKYPVTDILTNPIVSQGPGSELRHSLDELAARLILANPTLFGKVAVDRNSSSIIVLGKKFRVYFRNFEENLDDIGNFDVAILATSRNHVRSNLHLNRLNEISTIVVGVAENPEINAIYPAISSAKSHHFADAYRVSGSSLYGAYALGSCQCAGWTVGLRIIAEYCERRNIRLQDRLIHSEVDIIHPDTASSNFGMKHIGARTEDPRDNMRPGISQVAKSMLRFRPATSSNTVSLRVLTQPPGYQIQRFFLGLDDVSAAEIRRSAVNFAKANPRQLQVSDSPIGSRAYSATHSSTVIIGNDEYLKVNTMNGLSEIVLQGYVHNTLGYCAAILDTTDRILGDEKVTVMGHAY